ncbi:DNA polymerase III subunit chi [Aquincola sp. MAHUQ-54]|uniref:DNA polymerase III subunit chi n=1 Tax=Aquincola agrisoli TaxID=3119538 RepID=A0AAW9PYG0_9BURK
MPSAVEFHTGMADKVGFACRLLRKAYAKGARVAVRGAPELLGRLDEALWLFDPQQFVPHVRVRRGPAVAPRLARTPLWLLDPGTAAPGSPAPEVLVNLGPEMPEDAHRFARVIEIVAADPGDREAGRRRWRAYEAQGAKIVHHAQGAA